jgi:hypothetical protein
MKKNHLGSSFSDAVKEWEKECPKLRVLVEEKKEEAEKIAGKTKIARRD